MARQGAVFSLKKALVHGGYDLRKESNGSCATIMVHHEAAGAGRLARLPGRTRRIIHVVDELAANLSAGAENEVVRRFHALQGISTATLLTSDYCLEVMAKAKVFPRNPWVVKLPPDPDIFFRRQEAGTTTGSPVRLVVLAHGLTGKDLAPLSIFAGDSAYSVTIVSDGNIPEAADQVVLNPDAEARARLARESHIVVALSPVIDSHCLLEYLACGLPVVMHERLMRYQSTVGMAGLSFSGADTLRRAVSTVACDLAAFSMAACVPRLDEGLDSIRKFIAEV